MSLNTIRMGMACQLFDQLLRDAVIETGHQGGVVDEEDGFALYGFAADGQGQAQRPVEQDLEQQILLPRRSGLMLSTRDSRSACEV